MAGSPELKRADDRDQDVQDKRRRPNHCWCEAEQGHRCDVAGSAGVPNRRVQEGNQCNSETKQGQFSSAHCNQFETQDIGCRIDSSLIQVGLTMRTIILLTISNIFMNLAWYGHLKFKDQPLWIVVLASWGIAFFEYVFQVPANRIGSNEWTVPQLKVLQECITLIVFTVIAFTLFRSPLKWNYLVSYTFIIGAVYFAFRS